MPPTTAPRVKTRFTNTKGERVTVMSDGTKTRVPATPTTPTPTAPKTDIPVTALENQTTPVQVPQAQLDPTTAMDTAVTGSEAITTRMIADAEAQKKAAETQQSATDARIKELFGLQGQAPAMRQQLEQDANLEEKQRLANQIKAKADLVARQRELFNIDTENMTVSGMLDASTRDITKRTFSAIDTRNRLERALESNRQASELIGLNAQFQIAAGDVQLAQDSVKLAMETFYKPIEAELEMQKMFFQRNENRMSEAQRNLAQAQQVQVQRQFAEIDRMKDTVDAAMATGAASPSEVAVLTSTTTPDNVKLATAQLIVARGAKQIRDLDLAIKGEQLAKLREPQVATRETSVIEVGGNKQLIDTQTGEVIATFGAETSVDEIQTAKKVQFANTVDLLRTHPGMNKAVGPTGFQRIGIPFYSELSGNVSDFTGSVENITRQLTLTTFEEAKARGVTFGAASEAEWKILGDTATKINNWRRERDDGSVYYATTESNMKRELDEISRFGKADALRKGANPEDIGVLINDAGQYVMQGYDGSHVVIPFIPPTQPVRWGI